MKQTITITIETKDGFNIEEAKVYFETLNKQYRYSGVNTQWLVDTLSVKKEIA